MATGWTIRHSLMPLQFKDLMKVTEKLQFIDPTFRHSCLLPSSSPLIKILERSVQTLRLFNFPVTFIKSLNQCSIKPCLKAKYVFTRTSVATVCAITTQLAWLDLRTRDTNVCIRLVTRGNIVKKVRATMRCIKHIYYYMYASVLQPFKFFYTVSLHMSYEHLRFVYNTLYPFVSFRVVYRALIICFRY